MAIKHTFHINRSNGQHETLVGITMREFRDLQDTTEFENVTNISVTPYREPIQHRDPTLMHCLLGKKA